MRDLSTLANLLGEEVIYVVPYERKRKEPEYKSTGKFPKIDEAIAAAKKFKK